MKNDHESDNDDLITLEQALLGEQPPLNSVSVTISGEITSATNNEREQDEDQEGRWCKKPRLSSIHTDIVDDTEELTFSHYYDELIKYKKKFGHCNVVPKSSRLLKSKSSYADSDTNQLKLYEWCSKKRDAYHMYQELGMNLQTDIISNDAFTGEGSESDNDILPKEVLDEIRKLNEIGFQWEASLEEQEKKYSPSEGFESESEEHFINLHFEGNKNEESSQMSSPCSSSAFTDTDAMHSLNNKDIDELKEDGEGSMTVDDFHLEFPETNEEGSKESSCSIIFSSADRDALHSANKNVGESKQESGNTQGKTFDDYFHDLEIFKGKFGHCNIPHQSSRLRKLYEWCNRQRTGYREYHMGISAGNENNYVIDKERIKRLQDIGFRWDDPQHTK